VGTAGMGAEIIASRSRRSLSDARALVPSAFIMILRFPRERCLPCLVLSSNCLADFMGHDATHSRGVVGLGRLPSIASEE
jgi:hypothetical protein